MLREIKFKVYRKDTKEWGDIIGYSKDKDGEWIHIKFYTADRKCYYEKWYRVTDEDIVIMQYTGLNDKNGKEIYEFDECEVTRPCIWVTGFIKFHQGCFIFQEYKTGNILRLCDLDLNGYSIKVTGLTIDNPELLQEVGK